jgi:hypothetical protein
VVMWRFAKPRLSLIRYKGSTPLLSANCPAGRHGCMHSTANRKKEVLPIAIGMQDSDKKLFVDEYNSGMRRVISTSIRNKQIGALAEWIYMHRSEIPEIVVQFHGAPPDK